MIKVLLLLLLSVAVVSVFGQNCGPRIRRSWNFLTTDEKQLFFNAINALKSAGIYNQFADIHTDSTNAAWAHGKQGFFPWHREYLYQFENALRNLGGQYACITIPFWPWERDAGRESSSPVVRDFGGVSSGCISKGPFAGWKDSSGKCVQRQFDSSVFFVGEARLVDLFTSQTSYGQSTGWRASLEGAPHAAIHNYVSGHMGSFKSANDPIFFVHHANVDRLWFIWADCNGYINKRTTAVFPTSTSTTMPFNYRSSRSSYFPSKTINVALDMNNQNYPYAYPSMDHLVQMANTLLPGRCKWSYFTTTNTTGSTLKRDVEEVIEELDHRDYEPSRSWKNPEYPPTRYGFSNPEVDNVYADICEYYKGVYKNGNTKERIVREFETIIKEECHICSKELPKVHAHDSWIKMVGMEDVKEVFEPVCKPKDKEDEEVPSPEQDSNDKDKDSNNDDDDDHKDKYNHKHDDDDNKHDDKYQKYDDDDDNHHYNHDNKYQKYDDYYHEHDHRYPKYDDGHHEHDKYYRHDKYDDYEVYDYAPDYEDEYLGYHEKYNGGYGYPHYDYHYMYDNFYDDHDHGHFDYNNYHHGGYDDYNDGHFHGYDDYHYEYYDSPYYHPRYDPHWRDDGPHQPRHY